MSVRNDATCPKCAAIVLGAGASRRMGKPKALLPFGEEPLITHVVRNCAQIDFIRSIIVVTGQFSDRVADAVAPFDTKVVHNVDFDSGGMISSVKVGLRAIDGDFDAVFIALGDQPLITRNTFEALAAAFRGRCSIARPVFRDRHGHPILIGSKHIDEILQLATHLTLKDFVQMHQADVADVPVDDEAILLDVDTPDDYRRALDMLARRERNWPWQDEAATSVAAD